jgi:flagellar M-ring protein FliF
LPQQSLFSGDQSSPTASVLVKMNPGATLSADQVTGIEHLVASAVQGLKPDAVTVVDGSGNILSDSTGTSASATGLTALQAEDRYGSQLEA